MCACPEPGTHTLQQHPPASGVWTLVGSLATTRGCEGCHTPSRALQGGSSVPTAGFQCPCGSWLGLLVQPRLCQALTPSMQRAGGGGRRPLVPHLTVTSRCGTQGHACGWAVPAPRHVLYVCAWFVFDMWKM